MVSVFIPMSLANYFNKFFGILIIDSLILIPIGIFAYKEYWDSLEVEKYPFSKELSKALSFRYSSQIQKNIQKEYLENKAILSPTNYNSDIYIFSKFPSYFKDEVSFCEFEDLTIYFIKRELVYKYKNGARSKDENLFIFNCSNVVNIPYFILRDRLPIADRIRSLLVLLFNKTHYVNLKNDSLFSKKFTIEGIKDKEILAFFNDKIRNVFVLSNLKDITINFVNYQLYVRVAHNLHTTEFQAILYLAFTLFNTKNFESLNLLPTAKVIKKKKSLKEYLIKKTSDGEHIEIPEILGAFLFILTAVLVYNYAFIFVIE